MTWWWWTLSSPWWVPLLTFWPTVPALFDSSNTLQVQSLPIMLSLCSFISSIHPHVRCVLMCFYPNYVRKINSKIWMFLFMVCSDYLFIYLFEIWEWLSPRKMPTEVTVCKILHLSSYFMFVTSTLLTPLISCVKLHGEILFQHHYNLIFI